MANAAHGFESDTEAFVKWFEGVECTTFHPSIAVVDLRAQGAGRGIIATDDIPTGTTLFTIPRSLILSEDTSELPTSLFGPKKADGGLLDDDDGADDDESGHEEPWTTLMLILIREFLLGTASKRYPYLHILPESFDTPMFWSDEELSELRGTAVLAKVGRAEADRLIKTRIVPVVQQNAELFYAGSDRRHLQDDELTSLAHRMGSIIMAYAFDLEEEEDDEVGDEEDGWVEDRDVKRRLGMVPMADMLNADAEFNAHISHGDESLTAVSIRPILKGEEVLNYYGPLSNGELLRRYGYTTDTHALYDVVELPWEIFERHLRNALQLGDSVSHLKAWARVEKLLDREEMEDVFVLDWDTPLPDAAGRIARAGDAKDAETESHMHRRLPFPPEMEQQFRHVFKAIIKAVGPDSTSGDDLHPTAVYKRESSKRKGLFLQCCKAMLLERLGQYPEASSLAADAGQAERRSSGVSNRHHGAMTVRVGEQKLLRNALDWVNAQLEEKPANSQSII